MKPSRQVGQAGLQSSWALAFAFDAPRISLIIATTCSPMSRADEPRDVPRRPRADRRGEGGQPLAHGRGLVVDDVVDLAGPPCSSAATVAVGGVVDVA